MTEAARPGPKAPVRTHKVVAAVHRLTLAGSAAWLGAIVMAPALMPGSRELGGFLYALFSPVCHQIPGRSFFLGDFPLAVCGRCLGIYLGFFLGALAFPVIPGLSRNSTPSTEAFLLFSLPIGVDVLGNFLGLWTASKAVRLGTGLVWGLVLPSYFIIGAARAWLDLKKQPAADLGKS